MRRRSRQSKLGRQPATSQHVAGHASGAHLSVLLRGVFCSLCMMSSPTVADDSACASTRIEVDGDGSPHFIVVNECPSPVRFLVGPLEIRTLLSTDEKLKWEGSVFREYALLYLVKWRLSQMPSFGPGDFRAEVSSPASFECLAPGTRKEVSIEGAGQLFDLVPRGRYRMWFDTLAFGEERCGAPIQVIDKPSTTNSELRSPATAVENHENTTEQEPKKRERIQVKYVVADVRVDPRKRTLRVASTDPPKRRDPTGRPE